MATYKSRFDPFDLVILIHGNDIKEGVIKRVKINNGLITYEILVERAATNLDKDKIVERSGSQCWKHLADFKKRYLGGLKEWNQNLIKNQKSNK